ncbi:MAG: PilN domain-containing protein [Burkholderiales bacterium]
MIRINLLPHRQEKRKRRQTQMAMFAGLTVAAGALAWLGGHYLLNSQVDNQSVRNTYIKNETVKLDKQIEEIKKLKEQTQSLLDKKKVVENLQANRSEAVAMLDELLRRMPEGVYLKTIKQTGSKVNLTGYAQSNARVSTLMRAIEESKVMGSPELVEIKAVTTNNSRANEFSLNLTIKRPEPPSDKKKDKKA